MSSGPTPSSTFATPTRTSCDQNETSGPAKADAGSIQREISTAALGALVGGLLAAILLAVLILRRKEIGRYIQRKRGVHAPTILPTASERGGMVQLRDGRLEIIPSGSAAVQDNPISSSTQNAATSAAGPAANPPANRRPREFRYNQRQDSGISVKSIPIYSESPDDSELVLMRRTPAEDFVLSQTSLAEADCGVQDNRLSRITSRSSESDERADHSADLNSSTSHLPLLMPPQYVLPSASRSSLDLLQANNNIDRRVSVDTVASDNVAAYLAPFSPYGAQLTSSHQSNVSVDSAASKIYGGPSSRTFLTRPRDGSVSSGGTTGRFSFHRNRDQVQNRPRGGSSASNLVISSPLPETLVRSSDTVILPKGGLSEAQLAFMTSRESLALFTRQTNNEPPSFDCPSTAPSPSSIPSTVSDSPVSIQYPTVTTPALLHPRGAPDTETESLNDLLTTTTLARTLSNGSATTFTTARDAL